MLNAIKKWKLTFVLSVLEQIKNRVIGSFSSKIHRIIIVSDHGTSRMAVMVRNTEYDNVLSKPENIDIYKYGRYSNDTADEGKYPTAININNYHNGQKIKQKLRYHPHINYCKNSL